MDKEPTSFLLNWKPEIERAFSASNALCIALFNNVGQLIYANLGMQKLFIGDASASFINPTINDLLKLYNGDNSLVFEGLITIGDQSLLNPSLLGKVYHKSNQMLIIAEIDVNQLSEQNEQIIRFNNEINNIQRQLIKEKKTLEQTLKKLKDTQLMLIHSEKMNALGNLVAGVAHEINNPISFVYSNLHALQNTFKNIKNAFGEFENLITEQNNEESIERAKQIIEKYDIEFEFNDFPEIISSSSDGINRVKTIVEDLRKFSRLDEAKMKNVNLVESIKSTLALAKPELEKRNISYEIISPKSLFADCYPAEINQVVLNLLVNGMQAINSENGILTIELCDQISDVLIKISDNGCGIPEHIKKDIFNPFFSTKPVGMGTGLGLSIAYKIITEQHNGTIDFISEQEKGTTFTIKIPKGIR